MNTDRKTALLNLLALEQGKLYAARRRWERAVYPNWTLDEAMEKARDRVAYLVSFLRSLY